MPAGLTQLQVANRSLTEIARGNPLASGNVASNFDGTANGIYAATLYPGFVQQLLRTQDFEFSRADFALTLSGNVAPLGWAYEYLLPTVCMRVRQIHPAIPSEGPPLPVRWDVGSAVVSSVQTTVVWTNQVSAWICATTSNVTETDWDAIFTEQMVRLLGSGLALPTAGRPDFAREMLKIAGGVGQTGLDRDS
jgi:hypothetical protein